MSSKSSVSAVRELSSNSSRLEFIKFSNIKWLFSDKVISCPAVDGRQALYNQISESSLEPNPNRISNTQIF